MRPGPGEPRRLAPLLWTLLGLFVLRVIGQALVAFSHVEFLPPMREWSSGLVAYEYLLPSQIIIIAVMVKVCVDFTRRVGFFVTPRRLFAGPGLYFGWFYLATMIARYPIQMYRHPEWRWFGGTIPIVFHWVLAAFVIAVCLHHRRRLDS